MIAEEQVRNKRMRMTPQKNRQFRIKECECQLYFINCGRKEWELSEFSNIKNAKDIRFIKLLTKNSKNKETQ